MKGHRYTDLFLTFSKIGLFTFGGGYAMISMMEHYCVDQKKWITQDEMMDVTVIAESTPGPIAINCATFVGYRQAGFSGAVAATFAIVFPSFVILYLLSLFLDGFLMYTVVANAFRGIKIAVGLLILEAAIRIIQKMPAKRLPKGILICSALMMLCISFFSLNISSITLMLAAAALSLTLYFVHNTMKTKKESKQ